VKCASSFQVGPEVAVTLRYEVYDADGEHVGGSDGPRQILFGFGELLAPVERALEGASPGDSRTVRIPAKEAFGPRDPRALVEFERDEFPAEVAPGDTFEADGPDGEVVVLRVLDVTEDAVVVDQNHPLAGQTLRVEVSVLDTRPASADELKAAASSLSGPTEDAASPLIRAERLLRGPSRR
jgi:FKBP-type peptidyl-prolyl cis-trans isomerase 2